MDRQDLTLQAAFADVDRVVADPLRFKLRLGIGEDAYPSLRLKNNIQSWWDVGSWGFTGGAVAASPVVASTFFVPTGFLAVLGFGTAVTPIGWIAAAAIGSAGAYYGVTRLFGRYAGSRVDTIPKFINTPIDVLGAALFDLIGSLAIGVANIDGSIDAAETNTIADHFVAEWGFDPDYVRGAIPVLVANAGVVSVKDIAGQLASFQNLNPDCNAAGMRAELMIFLRDIAVADGILDEREELALDAVAAVMAKTSKSLLDQVQASASKTLSVTTEAVGGLATKVASIDIGRLNPFGKKGADTGEDKA